MCPGSVRGGSPAPSPTVSTAKTGSTPRPTAASENAAAPTGRRARRRGAAGGGGVCVGGDGGRAARAGAG